MKLIKYYQYYVGQCICRLLMYISNSNMISYLNSHNLNVNAIRLDLKKALVI